MEIVAHRGASGHYPENTLLAFQHAILEKADGIELDIHVSKDAQLVVIHDETIDRTSNGNGFVKDLTVSELKMYNFSHGKSPEFTFLPTLKEVLTLLKNENFTGFLNIEAKTNKIAYPTLVPLLKEILAEETWPFTFLLSSFNLETLLLAHASLPELPLALLTGKNTKQVAKVLDYPFIESLHPDFKWVEKAASELFAFPKKIRPWTMNKPKDLLYAKKLGVTGVITDFPKEAREILGRDV